MRGASVVAQAGGWGVLIQYGMTERVLVAKRGAVRIFRKFETLVGYLRNLGIVRYQVDASQYDPAAQQSERRRGDASERMKHAHEAAAYDDWLRSKVVVSLAGLEQGTNQRIELDEWAQIRAGKRGRAA